MFAGYFSQGFLPVLDFFTSTSLVCDSPSGFGSIADAFPCTYVSSRRWEHTFSFMALGRHPHSDILKEFTPAFWGFSSLHVLTFKSDPLGMYPLWYEVWMHPVFLVGYIDVYR